MNYKVLLSLCAAYGAFSGQVVFGMEQKKQETQSCRLFIDKTCSTGAKDSATDLQLIMEYNQRLREFRLRVKINQDGEDFNVNLTPGSVQRILKQSVKEFKDKKDNTISIPCKYSFDVSDDLQEKKSALGMLKVERKVAQRWYKLLKEDSEDSDCEDNYPIISTTSNPKEFSGAIKFEFPDFSLLPEEKKLSNSESKQSEVTTITELEIDQSLSSSSNSEDTDCAYSARVIYGGVNNPKPAYVKKWYKGNKFADICFSTEDGNNVQCIKIQFSSQYTCFPRGGLIKVEDEAGKERVFSIVTTEQAFYDQMKQSKTPRVERSKQLVFLPEEYSCAMASNEIAQAEKNFQNESDAKHMLEPTEINKDDILNEMDVNHPKGQQRSYFVPAVGMLTVTTLLVLGLLYAQKINLAGIDLSQLIDAFLLKYRSV